MGQSSSGRQTPNIPDIIEEAVRENLTLDGALRKLKILELLKEISISPKKRKISISPKKRKETRIDQCAKILNAILLKGNLVYIEQEPFKEFYIEIKDSNVIINGSMIPRTTFERTFIGGYFSESTNFGILGSCKEGKVRMDIPTFWKTLRGITIVTRPTHNDILEALRRAFEWLEKADEASKGMWHPYYTLDPDSPQPWGDREVGLLATCDATSAFLYPWVAFERSSPYDSIIDIKGALSIAEDNLNRLMKSGLINDKEGSVLPGGDLPGTKKPLAMAAAEFLLTLLAFEKVKNLMNTSELSSPLPELKNTVAKYLCEKAKETILVGQYVGIELLCDEVEGDRRSYTLGRPITTSLGLKGMSIIYKQNEKVKNNIEELAEHFIDFVNRKLGSGFNSVNEILPLPISIYTSTGAEKNPNSLVATSHALSALADIYDNINVEKSGIKNAIEGLSRRVIEYFPAYITITNLTNLVERDEAIGEIRGGQVAPTYPTLGPLLNGLVSSYRVHKEILNEKNEISQEDIKSLKENLHCLEVACNALAAVCCHLLKKLGYLPEIAMEAGEEEGTYVASTSATAVGVISLIEYHKVVLAGLL
ncbi:MAG: hypothetical protein QW075_00565 [Thermofilaceae archaeon]